MKLIYLLIIAPLFLVGCSNKPDSQQDKESEEMAHEQGAQQEDDSLANEQAKNTVAEIKKGLVLLSSANDPALPQIYDELQRLEQKGKANQQELDYVKSMIESRTAYAQERLREQNNNAAQSPSNSSSNKSEIAKEVERLRSSDSSSTIQNYSQVAQTEILKLTKLNDPNISDIYTMYENLEENGVLSKASYEVLMKKIGEHRQITG